MATKKPVFTPGPWSYCCDSGYSSKCLRGVQHSKKAAVHAGHGDRQTIASHIANWADARLIETAPDLLKMLKWAMRRLSDHVPAVEGTPEYLNERAALSVIAKAEGREAR